MTFVFIHEKTYLTKYFMKKTPWSEKEMKLKLFTSVWNIFNF